MDKKKLIMISTMLGRALKSVSVPSHHGDLTWNAGKVYVAVNLGAFNDPDGNADNWVYFYDGENLTCVAKRAVPEVVHGVGAQIQELGRRVVQELPHLSIKVLP